MKTVEEIRKIMDDNKIIQEEIAEDLGINQQNISAWFSRNSIPKKRYDAFMESLNSRIKTDINNNDSISETNYENTISVKLYDMSVSAGVGFNIESLEEMPFSSITFDRNLLPKNILSSDIVAMRVDGKSMIPTILPDEIVIYKEEIGKYSGDALYIVNFGGMLMVKRIQYNPELNKFDIIADNPQFKSYSVDLADDQTSLIIIGKVIATIQQ